MIMKLNQPQMNSDGSERRSLDAGEDPLPQREKDTVTHHNAHSP